jgi:multidrug efflux pump subunit AcrA (membrane-fusion protein)
VIHTGRYQPLGYIPAIQYKTGFVRNENEDQLTVKINIQSPYLERDGKKYRISAGMLVSAEVNLGSRTVMEYLLSPVQKVTHEAGREM